MFKPRPKEPSYAFVPRVAHPEVNRYGQAIETVPDGHELRGQSLNINGDTVVAENPNRYKQHGFFFTADNCIACHACEAACSEKNNLPPHIAFRSVGYVEGGSWPAYQRLNISMACNHCDDPVCLKGCPTRAYTKFAEYGAVLQDPDICFGCGYCTWVCPYNAPQLDPIAGHVSKCNMCVDRLEAGLKPACAAACLAGALDFGVIETAPANRTQLDTRIPGFPTPDITHPNIRFQQVKSLPRELTRPDSMPIRYVRTEQGAGGAHRPDVDDDHRARGWNLKKLSTRENPIAAFTLLTQAVVGAFALLFLAPLFGIRLLAPDTHPVAYPVFLFSLIGAQTFALVLSTLHLGRPHRFYRAFNNLRYSPVSREVAGLALFYNLLGAYALLTSVPALTAGIAPTTVVALARAAGWATVMAGVGALYLMYRAYCVAARPFWNHWQALTTFFGNMFTLGALTLAVFDAALTLAASEAFRGVPVYLAAPMFAGLVLEAVGLVFHARDLTRAGGEVATGPDHMAGRMSEASRASFSDRDPRLGPIGEGAASHYEQTTTFGWTYRSRNVALALAALAVTALTLGGVGGAPGLALWLLTAVIIIVASAVGRLLFYALVIPTTMPGAFFWRNRGFEEHARETGLAAMPQVGVVMDGH